MMCVHAVPLLELVLFLLSTVVLYVFVAAPGALQHARVRPGLYMKSSKEWNMRQQCASATAPV